MLTATDVTLHHGPLLVLSSVTLAVGPRSRIGLVGPNGIGKSTLLRVLAGLERPESGAVRRDPPSLRVGYLPQEPDARPGETLRAFLARRTGVAAADAELERLTGLLAEDPGHVDAYSAALEHFLALGGDDLDARAQMVLADVGLPADRLGVDLAALSGGQAARATLAAILLARFDVFLLDEPTNNLDFAGLDRLERFLDDLPGGVVVVSHDRAFLDRAVDRIVEITEPHHTAAEYAGGWSDYVAQREDALARQAEGWRKADGERSRLTERMRTQRAWAEEGVRRQKRKPGDKDRAARGAKIERTEKQAAKVRASERAIERLPDVEKPWGGWQLQLTIRAGAPGSEVVARLTGAVVRRGAFVLGPIDLEVRRGERVAIVGPNGSGKSTLLAALLGRLPLEAGQRRLGPGVVVGEMDQARERLAGARPTLAAVAEEAGLTEQDARSLLAKFGLGADHVLRPGADLSPGQRTRAILAVLSARGVNCLVLDEPTNHLDLEAIEQLEGALGGYDGTLILVTHDRRLLEAVRIDRRVDLG
ncbi:MAG: hypothetical protein QOK40_1946 [Miltoncostaeaceae bacterium]|nr:hypothetical protein [Miltoncostaeaceae bacterium]